MKVILKKYLNVRVGKPSVNAPCYQYLAPGSEIEVDGKEYTGDPYDGIDTWYRDEANNYYWSGGIQYSESEEVNNEPNVKPDELIPNEPAFFKKYNEIPSINSLIKMHEKIKNWWIEDYEIHRIWKEGIIGQNVNIVVIDTGYVLEHPLKSDKLLNGWNYIKNESNYSDSQGHGSGVVSILNSFHEELLGVAPGASIYVAKSSTKPSKVLDVINKISKIPNVDLISFSNSYRIKNHDFVEAFKNAITLNDQSLFVCAAGNNNKVNPNIYPAGFDNVVTVGSIEKDKSIWNNSNKGSLVSLYAPGSELKGLSLNNKVNFEPKEGTSFSTPYITGVLALLISWIKKKGINLRNDEIKKILIENADILVDTNKDKYKIIAPYKTFLALKKI